MKKWVNLTPHDITVVCGVGQTKTIQKSGIVARVEQHTDTVAVVEAEEYLKKSFERKIGI